MIRSRLAALDEDHLEVGSVDGDDQSRDTAAAAEVEDRTGRRGQRTNKCAGVLDDLRKRTLSQHPEPLRQLQRPEQSVVRQTCVARDPERS